MKPIGRKTSSSIQHQELKKKEPSLKDKKVKAAGSLALSAADLMRAELKGEIKAGRAKPAAREVSLIGIDYALNPLQIRGEFYEVPERVEDSKSGGSIFRFRVLPEFDYENKHSKDLLEEAYRRQAPAVELNPQVLAEWCSDRSSEMVRAVGFDPGDPDSSSVERWNLLRRLGFSVERVNGRTVISVPDLKALSFRWNQLREEHPSLPELKMAYTEGIASDEEFCDAMMHVDCIVSTDKEFLHDQVHVLHTLQRMWNLNKNRAGVYESEMADVRKDIRARMDLLKEVSQEWLSKQEREAALLFLGAILDSQLARSITLFPGISRKLGMFKFLMQNRQTFFPTYLQSRGMDEETDIRALWNKIEAGGF